MSVSFDRVLELMPGAKLMAKGYALAHCPWHDDEKRSLLVFEDGWWECLGECATRGHIDRLYDELQSPGTFRRPQASFEQKSIKTPTLPPDLDELSYVVWDAHEVMKSNSSFRWYVEMRGVVDRVEPCVLGWWEGWVTIPIFNQERELVGAVARAGAHVQEMTGLRFTQVVGQKPLLYVPDWKLIEDPGRDIGLVFGMFDALALADLRLPVVTTTGGKDSFNPGWLEDRYGRVYVIPDRGEESTALKLAGKLGWKGAVHYLEYEGNVKDPADYLKTTVKRRDDLLRQLAGVLG